MKMTLEACPPFDFDLTSRIFSGGDDGVRRYDHGKFWQVVAANHRLVLVTIKSNGTVSQPKLEVQAETGGKISDTEAREITETVQ